MIRRYGYQGMARRVGIAVVAAGVVVGVAAVAESVDRAGAQRSEQPRLQEILATPVRSEPQAPIVTPEVLRRAIGSEVPERVTMTDEIEHFEARMVGKLEPDRLALTRLVSAHALRFRAYGGPEDLGAAGHYLDRLEAIGATPEALSFRASLALLSHDFPRALEAAAEANRLSADLNSGLRFRLFDALWASGQYAEARVLLDLPHDRRGFDYLVREARVFDRLGETRRARDNLVAALADARAFSQPRAVIAWALTELGHFELHSGHPESALERYLEALKTLPGSPEALMGIGGLAMGVDRNPGAAASLFTRALAHGAHPDVYVDLAEALEASRQHASAEAARARFLRSVGSSPELLRQNHRPLALLFVDRGEGSLVEALALARRDLELRQSSEAWDTLAWVRFAMGDLEAAYEASLEATAWGVPEPLVLMHAGLISHAFGDPERATHLLEEARGAEVELTESDVARIDDALRAMDSRRIRKASDLPVAM